MLVVSRTDRYSAKVDYKHTFKFLMTPKLEVILDWRKQCRGFLTFIGDICCDIFGNI
jgi:hypothetical protein